MTCKRSLQPLGILFFNFVECIINKNSNNLLIQLLITDSCNEILTTEKEIQILTHEFNASVTWVKPHEKKCFAAQEQHSATKGAVIFSFSWQGACTEQTPCIKRTLCSILRGCPHTTGLTVS